MAYLTDLEKSFSLDNPYQAYKSYQQYPSCHNYKNFSPYLRYLSTDYEQGKDSNDKDIKEGKEMKRLDENEEQACKKRKMTETESCDEKQKDPTNDEILRLIKQQQQQINTLIDMVQEKLKCSNESNESDGGQESQMQIENYVQVQETQDVQM